MGYLKFFGKLRATADIFSDFRVNEIGTAVVDFLD